VVRGKGQSLGRVGQLMAAAGLVTYLGSLAAGAAWGTVTHDFTPGMMALNLGGCGLSILLYGVALVVLVLGQGRLGVSRTEG
jgi:hypothetical protein